MFYRIPWTVNNLFLSSIIFNNLLQKYQHAFHKTLYIQFEYECCFHFYSLVRLSPTVFNSSEIMVHYTEWKSCIYVKRTTHRIFLSVGLYTLGSCWMIDLSAKCLIPMFSDAIHMIFTKVRYLIFTATMSQITWANSDLMKLASVPFCEKCWPYLTWRNYLETNIYPSSDYMIALWIAVFLQFITNHMVRLSFLM